MEKECICKGNWRKIIQDSLPLFGRKYKRAGKEYIFLGVMRGEDDFYYCMFSNAHNIQLFSCIDSIKQHGFVEVG